MVLKIGFRIVPVGRVLVVVLEKKISYVPVKTQQNDLDPLLSLLPAALPKAHFLMQLDEKLTIFSRFMFTRCSLLPGTQFKVWTGSSSFFRIRLPFRSTQWVTFHEELAIC